MVVWFLLWFLSYIVMFPPINSKEDTIKNGDMSVWYRLAFGKPDRGSVWPGNLGPQVETCGTGEKAEFWFITYPVNTTFAEAIHVDVEAELTLCFDVGNATYVPCYSNSFEVFFNPGIYNSFTIQKASINELLENLTPLHNITNHTHPYADLSKSTQTFAFKLENHVQNTTFAIRSRGACGKIFRMKMYYYYCEETFTNGIKFGRTSSPLNGSKVVLGNCSVNSSGNVPRPNPKRNCSDNGNCSHDSSANNVTSFMNLNSNCSGNSTCSDNSLDDSFAPKQFCYDNGTWSQPVGGNLTCSCDEGFSLNETDGSCSLCSYTSYRKNISTDGCIQCPSNTVANMERTSCICDEGFYNASRDTTTMPCYALPVMKKLSAKSFVNGVNISWIMPDNSLGGPIVYDVECFICNQTECNISCTNEQYDPRQKDLNQTWVIVSNLTSPKKYMFRVYPRNILNADVAKTEWNYTEIAVEILPGSFVRTTNKPKPEKDSNLLLYIIIGVGILLLLILIAFLIIFVLRGRKVRQFRRSQRLRINQDLPLGERNYIDPTTYDDPERAVLEFTKELDRSVIKFEAIIGGGEFGDVYKGEINLHGQPATKVAIKTLKSGATHKNRTDFLLEASVMGQFKNLNVIALEGVVTKSTPFLIVIEYMENGSLDKYLKHNDGMLKPLQLLGMARGVASGMHYLAGMHFVHRDLAARNVLVNTNKCCKVADFGLSRDIGQNQDSEYQSQGGKIPVRWTAPEAITYRKFSTASDIWSYGILLWEIMSFAERPYWNWGNEEVMKRVDQQGYRLPPPMNCPKIVHQLMKECWLIDRTKRPPFKEIVRILDEWIKYPEKLNKDNIKVRRNEPLDYSTFTSVKEWLDAIKMGMYASNFSKAGYDELSDVAVLTEDELLKKVGVRLLGHRRKIYQRIKEMSEELKLQREPSVRI